MFFSFDGLDGAGKSTQAELFCGWLSEQGREVVRCRDPGSTPLGEKLRTLLLDKSGLAIGRRAEMLLFMAARAQLVDEVIRPALELGRVVVCDRYLLANVVYQGYAGGLDVETIWEIGRAATAGVMPDLVFALDLPPAVALARLDRAPDRMESQAELQVERLRQGFLTEAARRPGQIVVIDADRPVDAIQAEIRVQASLRLAAKS